VTLRAVLIGVLAAFVLNLVWENAQAFLFAGYAGPLQHFWTCFVATLGDLAIIAAIYGAVALLWRDAGWYRRMSMGQVACAVVLGMAIAVAIEAWALASGRWAYDGMPLVPFTGIGLVPVLQMVILPPLIFVIMWLSSGRPG
jgi:hypothetical protein